MISARLVLNEVCLYAVCSLPKLQFDLFRVRLKMLPTMRDSNERTVPKPRLIHFFVATCETISFIDFLRLFLLFVWLSLYILLFILVV